MSDAKTNHPIGPCLFGSRERMNLTVMDQNSDVRPNIFPNILAIYCSGDSWLLRKIFAMDTLSIHLDKN